MSEVNKELYKSKIGGQALIEGVMMSGVKKGAMACRLPNGEIDLEVWDKKPVTAWYRRTPIIRGLFNFGSSMKEGYRCLMKSAEKQMDDEEAEEDEKLSDKAVSAIMSVAMVIGIVIAVGLFVILPKKLVPLIHPLTANRILQSFAEGILKIILLSFCNLAYEGSAPYI